MADLQTILEKDKERFMQNASAANNRQEVVKTCEDELGRVLYTYNEQEESDRVKEEAARLVKTLRASVSLIDTAGETKIYRKSQITADTGKKTSKLFPLLLGAGVICIFAAGVFLYAANHTNPQNIYPIICLMAAGALVLFFAGLKMKHSAGSADDITTETMPDLNLVFRSMLMGLVTADQILAEVRSTEERQVRKERHETKGGLDDKTISLFSNLLEETYTDDENPSVSTIRNDLKYFLHARGIEAVDYTEEHKNWFDRMPGKKDETLRPALVMDELLLKKGLASGGR